MRGGMVDVILKTIRFSSNQIYFRSMIGIKIRVHYKLFQSD